MILRSSCSSFTVLTRRGLAVTGGRSKMGSLTYFASDANCLLRCIGASSQGLSFSVKLDQIPYLVVVGHCFYKDRNRSWQASWTFTVSLRPHSFGQRKSWWQLRFNEERNRLYHLMRDVMKNCGKEFNSLQSTLWSQLFSLLPHAKYTPFPPETIRILMQLCHQS